MDLKHVATYLNDHLAGSVVALELLEHLEQAHKGTPTASFAAELRVEIAEDRQELEGLMAQLGIAQSAARKATAWVSEKLTEVKLKLDDLRDGSLRRLEMFEALSVGIEGKRLLWRSLSAGAETVPALRGLDYARLEQRAEEQRQRVEVERLDSARAVLGSTVEAT